MSDIVDRLLRWGYLTGEAATEIERLRGEVDRLNQEVSILVRECQTQKDLLVNGATLTAAEREAVLDAALAYESDPDEWECAKIAATLRGLLERLG